MLRARLERLERAADGAGDGTAAVDREHVIQLPVFGPGDPLFISGDQVHEGPDGRRLVVRPVLVILCDDDHEDGGGHDTTGTVDETRGGGRA